MGFNASKCKVMHMGRGNMHDKFELGGEEIKKCVDEKDLGVVISSDGKKDS